MLNITSSIRKYYPVPDTSIKQLVAKLEERYYKRGHLIVKAGVRDKYVYFIERGCTRTYFLAKEKEVTNWFSSEGDITFSSDSLYHNAVAKEYIEVLEEATIFVIKIDQLERLLHSDVHLANW